MVYVSSYEVEVRSYELDVYNHVNNAVYLNWLEHGRSKLLQDKGFDYLSIMDAWGVRFMTVHTGIDYHKALKLGDRASITTQVAKIGNTSFTVAHTITRLGDTEPSATAEVVIVYTDVTTGRPTPVPEDFKRLYG